MKLNIKYLPAEKLELLQLIPEHMKRSIIQVVSITAIDP